jgi:hypothetical protein
MANYFTPDSQEICRRSHAGFCTQSVPYIGIAPTSMVSATLHIPTILDSCGQTCFSKLEHVSIQAMETSSDGALCCSHCLWLEIERRAVRAASLDWGASGLGSTP